MALTLKTYQVISARPAMVDANGNATLHLPGSRFTADPTNRDVMRLLKINCIREVTLQELKG